MTRDHLLIIDDEPGVRKAIANTLRRRQWNVSCFANAAQCITALQTGNCDLLVTDVSMPDTDGLQLLAEVKGTYPALPVLVISGVGTIPMAVKAI